MSTKYKATMPDTGYFVTITIVGWVKLRQTWKIMCLALLVIMQI